MFRTFFLPLLALLVLVAMHSLSQAQGKPERWVVYYTDHLPADAFKDYDVIAFDSDTHPPLSDLKQQGKILLGYISFGEAEKYRSYYKEMKSKNLLLANSKSWKDHTYVDVRNPEWATLLIDKLIPAILAQGFDGIMIDTIDSPVYVETLDPKKYAGMRQGAINLVKAVRAAFPNIKIMINRGLEILPDLATDVDYLMAESTYTDWGKDPNKPSIVDAKTYNECLDFIQKSRAISPKLKVYSMDYWNMKDIKGVKHIYEQQRAQGFVPYVSTMNLQTLYPEPK